ADRLLYHEVEGRVDGMVREMEELENQRAELVVGLVIKMVKEVTKVSGQMEALTKSLTSLWSSLSNFQSRGREAAVGMTWLVPHLVTLENKRIERYIYGIALQIRAIGAAMKPTIIQSAVLKAGIKKENVRDDNKRSRTRRVFATITNPVRKKHMGYFARDCKARLRMVTLVSARNPTTARGAYFECGGTNHYKAACPRLNRAPRPGGNSQNQPMAIEGGQGRGNNGNQARRGAFMMGAEEARQDPNIVTGLPPSQEFKFRIDLIPRAMSVMKSPYRLTPSEIEELSSQLRELKDKDSENWSIRRIGTQYGVSGLLGVGSKNKIFQNFLELVWIRRIVPPGYGVSYLLDTAYQTYWVRRIEILGYGVLAESVLS
ncbi:hypothetical protein Tco_0605259, partial [Tanacetum coccineum]